MKPTVAIYLAGSIKKGHEKSDESFWTDEDLILLREGLKEYDVSLLNPAFRADDLSDERSVFGRDMVQVFCSNVVFVDARDRRGLGVGAEMMWAKLHRIPVVTWAPRNTHYCKDKATILNVSVDNFIHPFVAGLSDKIVQTVAEGAAWIDQVMSQRNLEIKGIDSIESAMQYYKERQLDTDQPMQDLIRSNPALQIRLNSGLELARLPSSV